MSDRTAYEIVEIPASGSYGTVCVARDKLHGRTVALKVLKTSLRENDTILARTRDEARMLYRLKHPDIVQLDGLVEIAGRPVLVMEWVEGIALDRLLHHNRDGLPMPVAVDIVRRTASALHAAWESPNGPGGEPMRIVHRDVKPANLLLSVEGKLKIVDFGIAHGAFEDRESITISTVMGSQNYLAPERLDGVASLPSVDVYSLGVTLFELCTGRLLILPRSVDKHAQVLETQLQYLNPKDTPLKVRDGLRKIVAAMCRHTATQRPPPMEVSATLQMLMFEGGITPDLKKFANEHVRPLFDARARLPPRAHPDYEEVRFLEEDDLPREDTQLDPTQETDKSSERADKRVRRFLERAGWPARLKELRWMLAVNPTWTDAPFVEVLESADTPWWSFWKKGPPVDQVVGALDILRHRRTERVLTATKRLLRHPDKGVAAAAQALIDEKGDPP